MSVTGYVNIFFIPANKYEVADIDLEFISYSPHGLFTWRRSNQQPPADGKCIATIEVDDALNGDHSVVLSERLMSLYDSIMTPDHIIKVLFDGVKAAVQQHEDGWLFVHSKSYTDNLSILDKIKLAQREPISS